MNQLNRPMGVPDQEFDSIRRANAGEKKKMNFSDIYAQKELKKILMSINPQLKAKQIYKMQLIMASLRFNSLMSPEFFQAKIDRQLYKLSAEVKDLKDENYKDFRKKVQEYINNCNVDNEEVNVIPN